jgi:hypothetical protein
MLMPKATSRRQRYDNAAQVVASIDPLTNWLMTPRALSENRPRIGRNRAEFL